MCVKDEVCAVVVLCFVKQKTAYEMRISDWMSDVCSSDLVSLVDPATNFPANPETGGQLIIGNTAASNTIYGGAGGDEIWGQGLADLLYGDAGVDIIKIGRA